LKTVQDLDGSLHNEKPSLKVIKKLRQKFALLFDICNKTDKNADSDFFQFIRYSMLDNFGE